MTGRKAVAVRPPRPITLPRSAGLTRTSRIEPRRSCLSRTDTSSGWSTTPRTRCSSASASTGSGLVGGLLGRRLSGGLLGSGLLGSGLLGRRLGGGLLGLLLGLLRGGLLGHR